jgi:hypothetical protein
LGLAGGVLIVKGIEVKRSVTGDMGGDLFSVFRSFGDARYYRSLCVAVRMGLPGSFEVVARAGLELGGGRMFT